jgi:hypothetical protein
MKKLILIILLLFATRHIASAQAITSTLTQLTTDRMNGEVRSSFNWLTLIYPNLAARPNDDPNVGIRNGSIVILMVDDGDGSSTGGGNTTSVGGGSKCQNGYTNILLPISGPNGTTIWCKQCSGTNPNPPWECPTPATSNNPLPPISNNPANTDPFN